MHPKNATGSSDREVATVRRLVRAHGELCRCCGLVSRRYGPTLPLRVLGLLGHLVIIGYHLLIPVLLTDRSRGQSPMETEFVIFEAVLVLHLVARLFFLVHPCSAAIEQVQ
ncbi:hypothetical protein ONE63_005019 [Megalurothrips usitatus]|uniref:Uncharacterized protein n=1 Tax=Megalurothrips usitatus TaxID=439358 RepID=A0AAV7X1J7_9NEOP|nr:hypothetical protein ONE63_005019 [Megalurothrips usitatus]